MSKVPKVILQSSLSDQLAQHGIDVEKEIMTVLSQEIFAEIDKGIMEAIICNKKPRNCYE